MNDFAELQTTARTGKNVRRAPKVSVVIPVYNISGYIAETLDSVFAQTFENYEIILVNDGSTDTIQLKSRLAPYLERIIYVEQKNAGAAQARNSAIKLASGELLAFLDGDDVWLPDFLASQIDFLERSDFEMVYCDALIFGKTILEDKNFSAGSPSSGAVSTVSLINADCNVITSGTVLKRELIDKFGVFDVEMRRGQDFEMWFRLAKNGVRLGFQTKVLLKYRVRSGSLTGTSVDRAERNITVMNRVGEKYDLNENERAAWEKQMLIYRSERELEKGKLCLAERNFAGARAHLAAANKFCRQPKLTLLNWLLRISPRAAARIFKTLRPAEFSQLAPRKS